MKCILDIVNRSANPAPWSEGDNIPWDDPAFSERMLAEHLSQEHERASRTTETIDHQVEWIFTEVLGSRPSRVLDLACGPGLYAHRFSQLGCECVGIDFSPASIRHARDIANESDLMCTFHQADLREESFGHGFDLVMMLYGQFNVFQRYWGREILKKAHAALTPGGSLVLEIQTAKQIQKAGKSDTSWYSAQSGLFSATPHLVLQENFWDADARASTTRFLIVDAETGRVSDYALSNEAYSEQELSKILRKIGFRGVERFPSLSGRALAGEKGLAVIAART